MNTVPYTNARRAGRTHPDVVEVIGKTDPRHPDNPAPTVPNRAELRARGIGVRKPVRLKARRRPVQTTTDAQEA